MRFSAVVVCVFVVSLIAATGCDKYTSSDYQSGDHFRDNGDGTVTNRRAGETKWLKNADCFGAQSLPAARASAAALKSGDCGLADGSIPGDWRVATDGDMGSMRTGPQCVPSIFNTSGGGCWSEGAPFTGVAAGFYWTPAGDTPSASGEEIVTDLATSSIDFVDPNTFVAHVWPVRRVP